MKLATGAFWGLHGHTETLSEDIGKTRGAARRGAGVKKSRRAGGLERATSVFRNTVQE